VAIWSGGQKAPAEQFVVYVYQFVAEQLNIPARTVFPYL
jgi:hypothetical protein